MSFRIQADTARRHGDEDWVLDFGSCSGAQGDTNPYDGSLTLKRARCVLSACGRVRSVAWLVGISDGPCRGLDKLTTEWPQYAALPSQ
jgi:hypothetical protein